MAVGEEPREPLRPVLLVNDLTPDALALHLEKSRPWAGVFSAEGGGFMGGGGPTTISERTRGFETTVYSGNIHRIKVQ